MITMTVNDAKTRFGELLDQAQREPVCVMRHNRVAGVVVSAKDYEAIRAFYANRLQHTLDEAAATAVSAGLDGRQFDALLADESRNDASRHRHTGG